MGMLGYQCWGSASLRRGMSKELREQLQSTETLLVVSLLGLVLLGVLRACYEYQESSVKIVRMFLLYGRGRH